MIFFLFAFPPFCFAVFLSSVLPGFFEKVSFPLAVVGSDAVEPTGFCFFAHKSRGWMEY